MKRVLLVLGSFAAAALTLAIFVALAAAIVILVSAPQKVGKRAGVQRDLISLNYGG